MNNELERISRCLIQVLTQHWLEVTEQNHNKNSEQPMSRTGFESGTSQTQVQSVSSTQTCIITQSHIIMLFPYMPLGVFTAVNKILNDRCVCHGL
jgi:hypothetical protein